MGLGPQRVSGLSHFWLSRPCLNQQHTAEASVLFPLCLPLPALDLFMHIGLSLLSSRLIRSGHPNIRLRSAKHNGIKKPTHPRIHAHRISRIWIRDQILVCVYVSVYMYLYIYICTCICIYMDAYLLCRLMKKKSWWKVLKIFEKRMRLISN